MKIESLKTNHIENPLGYMMSGVSLSWIVKEAKGSKVKSSRVLVATDEEMKNVISDSGERVDISSLDYDPDIELKPGTRYFWQVSVTDDKNDKGTSPVAFFETPVGFKKAKWITASFDPQKGDEPLFRKETELAGKPVSARLSICGLGVYEAYINGKKVGDEYLAPYYNDYNLWRQYQTYDVTDLLKKGMNCIGVMLGNGWYKGRFGFIDGLDKLYGDTNHLICELRVTYANGKTVIIPSDESWLCAPSPVVKSSIYDGEVWDARKEIEGWNKPGNCDKAFVPSKIYKGGRSDLLVPRLSLPVKAMHTVKPVKIIATKAKETVIDFGQEFTGWVEFNCNEPAGKEIFFQFGEILQDDKFYNDNLRSAKQEYKYISAGPCAKVRPHFTFYGFRFMKVQGMKNVDLKDFKGIVLYSDMRDTGVIETSNKKINRLFLNAKWGQRGNFLDVPTDCPQRDERMGWTGDAQVFSQTAAFNMYTPAFYRKFMYDTLLIQREYKGVVPHVVPDILGQIGRITAQKKNRRNHPAMAPEGACAWSDAGTVIPWTVYRTYGDKVLLADQYENMKAWTDSIRRVDVEKCGGKYLWAAGFHYGDWLALDNYHKGSSFGATDNFFVATAYYYYSTTLTARAAKVLGKKKDCEYYTDLAEHIKEAFIKEYYTSTGRLAVDTQTAYALVLWLDLIPEGARQRQIDRLVEKIHEEKDHLTTGFVGTPILCPVLTENGHADLAYTLLLNEDFPSWLYEVNMGATTIWERWNSVLPDGKISDTGMNSLNHYAYGSVVEWMYRFMCGIDTSDDKPGFEHFTVRPFTDARFKHACASFESPKGLIRSSWEKKDKGILFKVEVPFDTEAEFELTFDAKSVTVNGKKDKASKKGDRIRLTKGSYEICCE
ncbi:MAG: glycoside hydrolase family 78 protein [Lachnospiraceae bacterium]|nr:glycoside hydrolase family 78 protein [Lachnospiraceae bacterium]